MIGWLRREREEPVIEICGRVLPINVRRNPRARRLTLRLAPDGSEVRLSLPRWCPETEALAFAHARTGWLADQLARIPARRAPEPGGTVLLRGESLTVEWRAEARRTVHVADGRVVVGGPQDRVASRIQRWLEGEAQRVLEEDIAFYAGRAGIPVPPLRLSRAQRRWGSCSTSGTVRINWRLIQAPDMVRRSVVAHEIAHFLHFDHSPAFHAALAELFEGKVADADSWIRAHGRGLYASFG